jgi:hypothetical protein
MRRKRRDDFLDARISEESVILFRQGKEMLADGIPPNALAFQKICRDLHRALGLRPWMPEVFDFELYILKAASYPPHADFHLVEELHARLEEAAEPN